MAGAGRRPGTSLMVNVSIDSVAGWTGQPTITAWGRHLLSQVRGTMSHPGILTGGHGRSGRLAAGQVPVHCTSRSVASSRRPPA
jgi:hypothetical protein